MSIIPNNPTPAGPIDDNWFNQLSDDLASLTPDQRRQAEALIHALATQAVTPDAVDRAMGEGGTAAVSCLVADRAER